MNTERPDFVPSLAALLAKCITVFQLTNFNLNEIFQQIQDPRTQLEIISEMELGNPAFESEAFQFCSVIFSQHPDLYPTIFRILSNFQHLALFQGPLLPFIYPSLQNLKQLDELSANLFISQILDLISTFLHTSETYDSTLILSILNFIIEFIKFDNEIISTSAAFIFENDINFQGSTEALKSVVDALYSRLASDYDINIYGISQQCITSLQCLCKNYPNEVVPYLYSRIEQDPSLAFRIISSISLSLNPEQFVHCYTFVINSMKTLKEPFQIIESINSFFNLIHNQNIMNVVTVIDDIFPFICINDIEIRTQIRKILLNCFTQLSYQCKPIYIELIKGSMQIANELEIEEISDFIFWFLYFCESFNECPNFIEFYQFHYNNFLVSDNKQNAIMSLKVISACATKMETNINDQFINRIVLLFNEDESLISYSINIIDEILRKSPNNQMISLILPIIPKILISSDSSLKLSILVFVADLSQLNVEEFAKISNQIIDAILTPDLLTLQELGNASYCMYYALRFANKEIIDFQNLQCFFNNLVLYLRSYSGEIDGDLQNIGLCIIKIMSMFQKDFQQPKELYMALDVIINSLQDKQILLGDPQNVNYLKNRQM